MKYLKKLFNISNKEDKEIQKQEVDLSLDDLFVHNFIKKGGKFLYCLEKDEIFENLKNILLENKWKSILVTNSKLITFLNEKEINDKIRLLQEKTGKKVFPISSVANKGLEEVLNKVLNVIEEKKTKEDTKKWSP